VQVTRATFIPLLTSAHSDRHDPAAVREEAFGELTVVYTFGPDFGRRVVTHADLEQLQLPPQMLRQSALQHLEVLSSRAEFHGQPPALMLSFEGLESSLLLASDFWRRLEGSVPGELVVGVPARDVVIVTGSQSQPGLEKAKRCVERVFFAGGENLVSRGLLVRRGGTWEPFDRAARPSGRPTFGPAHQHGVGQPPRQYQEHPSWPGGERVPAVQPTSSGPRTNAGAPVRRRPMYPMHPVAPAAQMGPMDTTGSHRPISAMETTGSHRPLSAMDTTGSHRPISAMDTTGSHRPLSGMDTTGSHRPVSHSAARQTYRDWAAEVAEAAQYSAIPYSSMPYSAAPYQGTHNNVMPQQVMPQSAVPYSAVPHAQPAVRSRGVREPNSSWHPYQDKPAYQDESYSTGALPRALYQDYTPPAPEPTQPTYPASWGSAPESSTARPEFRTGPRARFSR
jgi:hypothetical protein